MTKECSSGPHARVNKQFEPAGKGAWGDSVSDADWNDWRWQLRNRVNTLADLEGRIALTRHERAGVLLTGSKLAMGVTPYFFNLIHAGDPECPIRRQVIPRDDEIRYEPGDLADPCGEDSFMPVPGLVHRYPDRVLFLVTDRCASYCRYCTRSRMVSGVGESQLDADHDAAIAYIAAHPHIRDVLLSGGDPLLLSDAKLESLLARLRAIPHVELLRIGSRIPIFMPQRITAELVAMLGKFHPLWLSVHTNHPAELTAESRAALERLANAGIPIGNQTVLLKGVNDSAAILKTLFQKLVMCRVRPYYLYQCDLIQGSAHLRTTVRRGLDIMNEIRGHTTGYAVPQYVVDGPGGGGKIPLNPDYILGHDGENLILRNYRGDIYSYPEPRHPLHRPHKPVHDEIGTLGSD